MAAVVKKMTELTVTCDDKVGALAEILHVLSKAGVNLVAYCGYGADSKGCLMLVPEDASKAQKALREAQYEVETAEVVVVESGDHVGAGAELARRIADAGINIHYSYATTAHSPRFTAVFRTENDDQAATLLTG